MAAVPLAEFAKRRSQLLKALGGAVGLVLAGEQDASLHSPWRPHPHFEYLTGVTREPGALLLLDPANPIAARRAQLFLRPLNPEVEKWDGFRSPVSRALRTLYGIETIQRIGAFPRFLLESARRSKSLACLHPLAAHNAPASPDLVLLRESAARIPGCKIVDHSDLLAIMRSRKSAAEVACIQRAVDITALGFAQAMKSLRPGISEFDLQESMEHAYKTNGARGTAYRTIAGGGFNSTVLHYHDNDQLLQKGDLVCVDSGAEFAGYAADITRTLPVSGKFTIRQREVYNIVLAALTAATKQVRAGATIASIDAAARSVISKAGFADAFIHGIGHHLGMEVHDATPDGPLRVGAVITIEPGIYLPDEKIGIRIEDDVLVTKSGNRVLSRAIPRTASDIERLMRP